MHTLDLPSQPGASFHFSFYLVAERLPEYPSCRLTALGDALVGVIGRLACRQGDEPCPGQKAEQEDEALQAIPWVLHRG
jgi:hypothetical protein